MTGIRNREALLARLRHGPPLIFDGALGTVLEDRGCPAALPLWSSHALLAQPELVQTVHAEYVAAGAEVLCADTFRTQARALAAAGGEREAQRLTARALALARDAADTSDRVVWVAGSQPPLEDCYRPDRTPPPDALRREHAEHAAHLAAAGADLVLAETHHSVVEIRAAVSAGHAAGVPVLASFVCAPTGELLSGEPLRDGIAAAREAGASGVGVNCVPPSVVPRCLEVLAGAGLPFGVYANLGAPRAGTRTEACDPGAFAGFARSWLDAGARWIGGCCGTGPDHVAALRALRDGSSSAPT